MELYANQLKVTKASEIKALVKHSYFNGKNYLIEAEIDSKTIYFEHYKPIKKGQQVFLSIIVN